jgi:sulfite reductase alpha subunit-like flavoprotein
MSTAAAAAAAADPDDNTDASMNHQAQDMETPPPPSITILWATQSGRAKACARRTVRLLQSTIIHHHTDNIHNNLQGLCAFDDVDFLSLGQSSLTHEQSPQQQQKNKQQQQQKQESILILFVSTTGDAEVPTTLQRTWSRLLSKSLSTTHFTNVKFALFALGDRAYGPDAYCAAGRKLAARLVRYNVTILYSDVVAGRLIW